MPRPPELHPHSDRPAFTRLMLLIATLVQYPGIGCPDPDPLSNSKQHHNALALVRDRLLQLAAELKLDLPAYSVPILRKDLETLRDYGILEQRMYRWGYYLGTGALNREELAAALTALATQAKIQGDPQLRSMYQQLERRLRGLYPTSDPASAQTLVYPIRSQLDQLIIHTDPEELRRLGHYQETLFDHLEQVEQAIAQGQALALYQRSTPYSSGSLGPYQVFPLQLLYHEIAWYLLYEECETEHLAIRRLDRLSAQIQLLQGVTRSQMEQLASLKLAKRLLHDGWGLFLGKPEPQRLERLGQAEFRLVKVRFFEQVVQFIVEGERRHPKQRIRLGPKDEAGRLLFVDYEVMLPERSLPEFFRWVNRFFEQAQVLAPADWVEQYRKNLEVMGQHYGPMSG